MKKIKVLVLSLIVTLCMAGCSLIPSVELTESEQEVIAEYAAGLLLKHDRNYAGSIKSMEEDEEEIGFVENEEAMIATPEIEDGSETEAPDPEFDENLTANSTSSEGGVLEYSDMSIAEAIGVDGFDIIYKSNETHEIYPEEESDDIVFSLQAQNGMELLVLNFAITNDGESKKKCDIIGSDATFRLLINGSERINAQRTILLNDMSSFSDELEGYAMTDAVLVFEVAKSTSENIDSLDLIVKKGDETTTHMLK